MVVGVGGLVPIAFAGRLATTEARKRPHASGEDLFQLLKKEGDPYMGDPPPALCQSTGLDEAALLKSLDRLSASLRKRGGLYDFWWRNLAGFVPNRLKQQVQTQSLGRGVFGEVHRIRVGGQTYALKVFHNSLSERIPACEEAANGLFINKLGARDVVRFHVANPSKGWLLLEYISPNTYVFQRPGKTLAQLGYRLSDSMTPENYINGIRVDLGGTLSALPGDKARP